MMKSMLIGFAFVFATAVAFAIGNVTAARSAADDVGSALGQDPKTGLPYLRVFVVNAAARTQLGSAQTISQPSTHTMTLAEGSSVPITGTLKSASAVGRSCDLIVFEKGQSRIILASPSGTKLNDTHVDGTVSATGNPLGYNCSVVLEYTTP
jgi:hypothetical protein